MRIVLATPAPPGSRSGNRATALRWARLLRGLGHQVRCTHRYAGQRCDLLVALHARRSAPAIQAYRRRYPQAPLIVVLTGTDLYGDLPRSAEARASLALADWLVALHPGAARALPRRQRAKLRVIVQSAQPPRGFRRRSSSAGSWDVCVIGHLRPVKDPWRAALAVRKVPPGSRLRIVHLGAALTPALARRARLEMRRNPRYLWLGSVPARRVWRQLASSQAMVLSSRVEGGANVLGEAIRAGVPVIASRIASTVGLLGPRYGGFFTPGDTGGLRRLLLAAEANPRLLERWQAQARRRLALFTPAHERAAWRSLLREVRTGRLRGARARQKSRQARAAAE